MDIYTSKHELIKISDTPLASGGEGEVREVMSAPIQYKGTCAKYTISRRELLNRLGRLSIWLIIPLQK